MVAATRLSRAVQDFIVLPNTGTDPYECATADLRFLKYSTFQWPSKAEKDFENPGCEHQAGDGIGLFEKTAVLKEAEC